MPADSRALAWDGLRAIALVREFTAGRSFEDYCTDVLLRSAVERQLEILGEALNRLSRLDPESASRIPDLRRIVAVRNILVHGYATVDDALVWSVVGGRLDALEAALQEVTR